MSRHYLREKSEATVFFVVNRNFHFKSYFRLAPTTVRLQTQSSSPVLSQRRFPPQQWASSCPARSRNVKARVAFFFKQWGGRSPKAGGRLLEGREWSQFPVDVPVIDYTVILFDNVCT
jgi:hypothetical protein